MTAPEALPAERPVTLRALIAPIAAITLFGLSLSMSYPIFGLLLERMGASGTQIGLNTMAAAVAIVAGAPIMPGILRRIGIGRLMVLASLGLIAMMLLAPLHQGFWYWTVIRLFYGLAGTALFFTSEYWIVAVAPEMRRGRIVAIYAFCVSAGFALGPAILGLIGLEGMRPFAAAAGVVALGLVMILWGLSEAPPADDGESPPPPQAALRVFVTDPGVLFAVVLFGVIEFGAMGLLPVWGVRSGLAEPQAAILLSVFAIGAMSLQMPLGWAADRFDRRWVLAASAAGSLAAPVALSLVTSYPAMMFWAGFWGAASVGLYSVALTEIGARYRGSALSVANAAVILGYGMGALAAPASFGTAMDVIPPDGLMHLAALVAFAYLALIAVRIWRAG